MRPGTPLQGDDQAPCAPSLVCPCLSLQSRRIADSTRMQLFQESIARLEKSLEVGAGGKSQRSCRVLSKVADTDRAAHRVCSQPPVFLTLDPRRLRSSGEQSQTSSYRDTLRASSE